MSGTRWTGAELAILDARYPSTPTHEIAAQLGRTDRQVYNQALRRGLSKSAAYMSGPTSGRIRPGANIGGKSRFQKGHKTWNVGMKGWQPNNHESRFKKGVMSKAHLEHMRPIGEERTDKDGYLERKVANTGLKKTDWRRVHHLLWEERYGPIPPGHIVIFKDRNKEHIAVENLELIDRTENMRRNTVHRLPKELALAVQAKGALQRQINKRMNP